MSIRLEINNATKEKIDAKILKTAVKVFGKKMKINKQTVSVAFVDQAKIKKLNKQYRGLNRVTDVLSFTSIGQRAKASQCAEPNYKILKISPWCGGLPTAAKV